MSGHDEGTATVEFALVLPAVVLTLAAALAALGAAGHAIRLADAAGLAARAEGRGDDASGRAAVANLAPGARMAVDRGTLVCVRLDDTARLGPLPVAVPLSARSCAAADGG
ncbi:TadE family type IV pilus minor pilin [Frondihabitans australicus]|uniref:TadE-like protein n=1 Tax=Frondihabitans australicus TaxID=386892 RepID=A0A495IAX6_9MICO|nr:TadE family type IV pilus minor pilin [Frondihabitans australicus]RKR73157.1 hypothetical protein C8E83_0246 [Frondihabitans australicus]